ncbi:MAG: two pore domain potassium channel family protein [Bacteroidales bacterium]|nr:MAG: two pore domain potassium channel family protein [Bacteroidales bacterium]
MILNYPSFKVEVKNIKFKTDEGVVLPKTAIVSFLMENREVSSVELYGHIDTEDIYRMIENGEPVNLDYCYIQDLSLSVYRSQRNLDRKAYVRIGNFSARHAFFDAKFGTDFSHAEFDNQDLSFDDSHFANGRVTFNSAKFGDGDVSFAHVYFRDGNVDFGNCTFGEGDFIFKNSILNKGIKDFQYTDFGKGSITFANTEFGGGEISFINTHFSHGNVSFKIARFGNGKIDFHYSKFGEGDISFERVDFGNSKVDFRTVEFNDGRVNFNRSVFGNGDVTFEGAEIKNGKFSFNRATLGDGAFNFELAEFDNVDAIFDRTNFGQGPVSFHSSRFHQLSLKSCHLDHYFDLRLQSCELLDLSDTIVRDIIDLKPYEFDVNITVLNLSGMRLLGTIYLDWQNNRIKDVISRQPDTSLADKAEQFRILKENFNQTGQYGDEDKSYVEFKRYEARSRLEKSVGKNIYNGIWFYPWHGFKWLVLDQAGLYATAPLRVLFSMLGWYVLFSLLYWILYMAGVSEIISGSGYELPPFARAFYHSAITFLTIGYGDHFPTGVSRIISSIEGFAGMFLMAYFTVSLVRKILR